MICLDNKQGAGRAQTVSFKLKSAIDSKRRAGEDEAMRIKVDIVGEGLHPSETVVAIETKSGTEELVLDSKSLAESSFEAGWPVAHSNGFYLVELPRETARGARRVWVPTRNALREKVPA